MRVLVWLLRIGLFFLLFAFALNNQHEVALKSLFGHEWRAPMIFIVLVAFVAGCALGVVAMFPSWWRQRVGLRPRTPAAPGQPSAAGSASPPAPEPEPLLEHPPRDGI